MAVGSDVARRAGRPRDPGIDQRISAAALEVLAESGFFAFAVADVVERTGVAKTTIYRRYPTREDLICAALDRLNDDLPAQAPAGTVREQLVWAVSRITRRTADCRDGRVFAHAINESARMPELTALVERRVLEPRRRALRRIIVQGVVSGELRADLDPELALAAVAGTALYLSKWKAPAAAQPDRVVDLLIAGMSRATGS